MVHELYQYFVRTRSMHQLIQIAKDKLEERYEKGKHSVCAAVRTKSGKVYTGLCMNSQKLNVCSEWVAVGRALTEGDKELEMVVAVHRSQEGEFEIFPPCGLCRELYLTYSPDIKVIFSETEAISARDLLPRAYMKN